MGHRDYAPDLFLLAHDPFTGRTEVSHDLLQAGVVAAELAHLLVEKRLQIDDQGRVAIRDAGRIETAADLDEYVLDCVRGQAAVHAVRVWVDALGPPVYDTIATNLVAEKVIRPVTHWRKHSTYPASDLLEASAPKVRIDHMLSHPKDFTLAAAMLVRLAVALRIEGAFENRHVITPAFLAELHRCLPTQMKLLAEGTEAAAADMTLAVHR